MAMHKCDNKDPAGYEQHSCMCSTREHIIMHYRCHASTYVTRFLGTHDDLRQATNLQFNKKVGTTGPKMLQL